MRKDYLEYFENLDKTLRDCFGADTSKNLIRGIVVSVALKAYMLGEKTKNDSDFIDFHSVCNLYGNLGIEAIKRELIDISKS
ncbi:MAG: hypothetical protein NTY20_00315 [Candidatus Aenigmarchaeota archaeon]|nr:hypothetical protein [Candidatus Aenigmarchaeota archaeon]